MSTFNADLDPLRGELNSSPQTRPETANAMTPSQRPTDLALFGGQPTFPEPVYVNRPNIGNQATFYRHMQAIFERRWFTNSGPLVLELERRLADYMGVGHCVATSNGTAALQLASQALKLSGEVIVPSFTFIATPHAMLWQGLEPIFCDIDPDTGNIDPTACEALITERTSAIAAVNVWGRPCDIDGLQAIARRHGLRLLFDSAHAFGCSHRGQMIGGFGDAEAWSFHATKVFHSFEGGAVTTNDGALAEQVRRLANFGFTGYDHVDGMGINAKMSEASAAMGLTNLDSIDATLAACRNCHDAYANGLAGIPGLSLLAYDRAERHNHHYVVLEVDQRQAGLSRDQLIQILHPEGIIARRYFYPGCHRMEPYVTRNPQPRQDLAHTDRLCERVLVLPSGAAMPLNDVDTICAMLRSLVSNSTAIRPLLEI